MTSRKPWTDAENAALVRLYFDMLDAEQAGERYIKAHMIAAAQGLDQPSQPTNPAAPLANRSRGSIEAKLMNATAAHATHRPGHETMDGHGYRALANYQGSLGTAMQRALIERDNDAERAEMTWPEDVA